MANTLMKWTVAEYNRLIDDGYLDHKNVQLIEGNIVEMNPEGIEHIYTNNSLLDYLKEILKGFACVFKASPVILSNGEPEPDIAILQLPAEQYKYRKAIASDVHWLIEISKSTLKFDREDKLKTYARNNIPEYWIVDLVNNKLIVYKYLKDGKYTFQEEFTSGTIFSQAFRDIRIERDRVLLYK